MADKVSKKRRSEIMASVKSKNTKPEILVRQFLFNNRLRFRVHDKTLFGTPDIKLTKYKTLIFVNGCFWHGHADCKIYVMPKINKKYWNAKIENNKKRDEIKEQALKKLGWKVIVLWECQLKPTKREETLNSLISKILSN